MHGKYQVLVGKAWQLLPCSCHAVAMQLLPPLNQPSGARDEHQRADLRVVGCYIINFHGIIMSSHKLDVSDTHCSDHGYALDMHVPFYFLPQVIQWPWKSLALEIAMT